MDWKRIEKQVETYLNHQSDLDLPEPSDFASMQERYKIRCLIRLKKAFQKFNRNLISSADFQLALRDYLLAFQTRILIKKMKVDQLDLSLLQQDKETGQIYASPSLSSLVEGGLYRDVFIAKEAEEKPVRHNLYTDPWIYSLTGFSKFKTYEQKLAVYGSLNAPLGFTNLTVLPTGAGKSMVTQLLAFQQEGLTIVVVPTVSLALDQARTARRNIQDPERKEKIFYYHSQVNALEIKRAIEENRCSLLFLSPEAILKNSVLNRAIEDASKKKKLRNLIIDEAHIVQDWGAQFRMDFQELEPWRRELLRNNPILRTFLLSATVDQHTGDLLRQLFSEKEKWIEVRCDQPRKEPRFIVRFNKDFEEKERSVVELIKKLPHPMIVYVQKPYDADLLLEKLQKAGFQNIHSFTGKTTQFNRERLIEEWSKDEFSIMIATSAFGVGVDKPDVRTVLHTFIPDNPAAYYQELGRGGRDGLPCLSVLNTYRPVDLQSARQRLSKRVMTSEKITDRWLSMRDSEKTMREEDIWIIDTAILPRYVQENVDQKEENDLQNDLSDLYFANAHITWNIYVLLFLRRHNKVSIEMMAWDAGLYSVEIKILDPALVEGSNEEVLKLIEKLRNLEADLYRKPYRLIQESIKRDLSLDCWSEMFYETYNFSHEYCAGCPAHEHPESSSINRNPLVKAIRGKLPVSERIQRWMGPERDLYIDAANTDLNKLIRSLSRQGVQTFAVDNHTANSLHRCLLEETGTSFLKTEFDQSCMVLSLEDVQDLLFHGTDFYTSGGFAVVYSQDSAIMAKQFIKVMNMRTFYAPDLQVIHILQNPDHLEQYLPAAKKQIKELTPRVPIPAERVII